MGLDSGFVLKSDKRKLTREDLPNSIRFPFSKDYGEGIDITYGRKWWGVRGELLSNIDWDNIKDNYYFYIENPNKLISVIEILASWLNKDRWENEGGSIWTYDEARSNIINWIINLAILSEWLKQNPDCYLYFYDSY